MTNLEELWAAIQISPRSVFCSNWTQQVEIILSSRGKLTLQQNLMEAQFLMSISLIISAKSRALCKVWLATWPQTLCLHATTVPVGMWSTRFRPLTRQNLISSRLPMLPATRVMWIWTQQRPGSNPSTIMVFSHLWRPEQFANEIQILSCVIYKQASNMDIIQKVGFQTELALLNKVILQNKSNL